MIENKDFINYYDKIKCNIPYFQRILSKNVDFQTVIQRKGDYWYPILLNHYKNNVLRDLKTFML